MFIKKISGDTFECVVSGREASDDYGIDVHENDMVDKKNVQILLEDVMKQALLKSIIRPGFGAADVRVQITDDDGLYVKVKVSPSLKPGTPSQQQKTVPFPIASSPSDKQKNRDEYAPIEVSSEQILKVLDNEELMEKFATVIIAEGDILRVAASPKAKMYLLKSMLFYMRDYVEPRAKTAENFRKMIELMNIAEENSDAENDYDNLMASCVILFGEENNKAYEYYEKYLDESWMPYSDEEDHVSIMLKVDSMEKCIKISKEICSIIKSNRICHSDLFKLDDVYYLFVSYLGDDEDVNPVLVRILEYAELYGEDDPTDEVLEEHATYILREDAVKILAGYSD